MLRINGNAFSGESVIHTLERPGLKEIDLSSEEFARREEKGMHARNSLCKERECMSKRKEGTQTRAILSLEFRKHSELEVNGIVLLVRAP